MRELCQAERPASTAGEEPSRLEGFERTGGRRVAGGRKRSLLVRKTSSSCCMRADRSVLANVRVCHGREILVSRCERIM